MAPFGCSFIRISMHSMPSVVRPAGMSVRPAALMPPLLALLPSPALGAFEFCTLTANALYDRWVTPWLGVNRPYTWVVGARGEEWRGAEGVQWRGCSYEFPQGVGLVILP